MTTTKPRPAPQQAQDSFSDQPDTEQRDERERASGHPASQESRHDGNPSILPQTTSDALDALKRLHSEAKRHIAGHEPCPSEPAASAAVPIQSNSVSRRTAMNMIVSAAAISGATIAPLSAMEAVPDFAAMLARLDEIESECAFHNEVFDLNGPARDSEARAVYRRDDAFSRVCLQDFPIWSRLEASRREPSRDGHLYWCSWRVDEVLQQPGLSPEHRARLVNLKDHFDRQLEELNAIDRRYGFLAAGDAIDRLYREMDAIHEAILAASLDLPGAMNAKARVLLYLTQDARIESEDDYDYPLQQMRRVCRQVIERFAAA